MTSAGLERRGGIPSMVLDNPAEPRERVKSLYIQPVLHEKSLTDHVRVVSEAFDWQPAVLAMVFTLRLLSDECWSGWVGYLDDEPVAASQLVVHEGVGGIYYVATVEAHRGRGFGEAITRHAVEQAASQSCGIVSLQASPAGYPVYVRMGFRNVAEYVTYIDGEGAQR
jgi:GNAT superfamily N-acetyltransferase